MRKFLAGLLAALLLLTAPIAPSFAISDAGRSEITRLWADTDNGTKFACTGSYIFPYISDYGSWIVTAGHCAVTNIVARNQATTVRGIVNWQAVLSSHGEYGTTTVDLAIGTVPDVRDGEHKRLWLADKMPTDPTQVYVHGFPEGVELVTSGILVPEGYEKQVSLLVTDGSQGFPQILRKTVAEAFPGTRLVLIKHDRVMGGSSGSPVLGGDDRIIGILWGGVPNTPERDITGIPAQFNGWDLVFVTPVERIHELFKSIGVDG